jgi:pimeloyl-ACP methyl ester carboxylesterase
VLGTTLDLPGASFASRGLASHGPGSRRAAPRVSENVLAGVPATVVQPAGPPPWPALVFMNGATPDGRAHPMVLRLGISLAHTGRRVLIPDLPGVAGGELSPTTLGASTAFTGAVSAAPETANGRVSLAGVSVGASLALLVAADPAVAERISVVVCIAPYSDLAKVMLLATTGTYRDGRSLIPYSVPPYLAVGLARSLAAMLPPTEASAALCAELRALDPSSAAALAFPERAFREAGEEAMTLFALLANRDPHRFDELYAALPTQVRLTVDDLSPLCAAARLRTPVEIATAPRDKYFPVAESRALVASAAEVRLTVTSLLAHATPRLSFRYVTELQRLNGFFVRALAAT